MLIKKIKTFLRTFRGNKTRTAGYTVLEVLVATGIAAIVITSAIGVTGTIYTSQRKIQFAQDFFSESRFLMERIAQIARNNTLDYDRYFIEIGPINGIGFCDEFDQDQLSSDVKTELAGDYDNTEDHRSLIGYANLFYWDTNADGAPDRNLGGKTPADLVDNCTRAWEAKGVIQQLFLINSARNERTAIRRHPSSIQFIDTDQDGDLADEAQTADYDEDDADFDSLELQRQLGADVNNDGNADVWGPDTQEVTVDVDGDGTDETGKPLIHWDSTNTQCILYIDEDSDGVYDTVGDSFSRVLGEYSSEDYCHRAHDFSNISPKAMTVTKLDFSIFPNRDPFLNFRVEGDLVDPSVDDAQIHPQVFINMRTDVREPRKYGYDVGETVPTLSFQTMVSSRVFGNTRQ